ncbi:sugar-binding transcriptional regulator [Enterococcus sp. 669A]|uniref:Sugar-binding transcriptional regulator n=1 Tax=Candidatus Enterococcus moelleringii TaxID=2815325 RepID=A0ABS3LA03_9ENTE|nr:sugar-binding transcriptional regulator [Enterococcus sp. 669A]MBO1306437.1 sugar-binding transcriptional regulator [Enterococcus sp. 669A]
MEKGQNNRDLVKVATMYHKENMKQSDIAERLGISRSLVSKYLIDAKNQGIVDIYIKSESAYSVELELKLEKLFGLTNAVVLDTSTLRENEIEKIIIQTAITAYKKDIAKAKKIGLSWGKILRRFVDEYPYENHPEATIIPLIGGMGSDYVDIHANQLAYDLARKLRAKCKFLYSPALVDNSIIRENLIQNAAIKDVLEAGRDVDMAVVGLASPFSSSNTMTEIGYINEEDIQQLADADVVGDINSKFFNAEGQEVDCAINKNVIGVSLESIRQIPKVATICYEDTKKEVLYAAMKSGIFNCVAVTDVLAEYLIERIEN